MKTTDNTYSFIPGGGEMGEVTRNFDWSSTPLGSPDTWSQSLRTSVSIVLASAFPMLLWWGDEGIQFYNDAFRPSLGTNGKHPAALGHPAALYWAENWHIIKPLIDGVLQRGEASYLEDLPLPTSRNGQMEDVYWTFSYSPVVDESGKPIAVLITGFETTQKVKGLAELKEKSQQLEFTLEAAELGTFDFALSTGSVQVNNRMREWLGFNPDEILSFESIVERIPETDRQRVTEVISHTIQYGHGGKYSIEHAIISKETGYQRTIRSKGLATFDEEKTAIRLHGTVQDITYDHLAKQQLAAREWQLTALFKQSPAAIAILEKDNLRFKMANDSYSQLVDYPVEGLIGKPLMEVLPELAGQGFDEILNNVIRTGVPFVANEVPAQLKRKGQMEQIYVDLSYNPMREPDNAISGVFAVVNDITQQVTARKKTEESETHLQLLRNTVPAMIFYLDEAQRYQSYNDTFMQWFDVDATEVIGKTVREFIGEQAYMQVLPHLERAYSGRQTRYELFAPSRMGQGKWLSITYTPDKADNGQILGLIVYAADITEHKQAQFSLQESEARFRSLIEEAPVATCLFVGREMRIDIANSAMIAVWGKGPGVIGKTLLEALPELKDQHFPTLLDKLFTTGESFSAKGGRGDLVIAGKRETFYFNYDFKPLRDASGEVYGILETAIDVTEQVVTQQKIKESEERLKGVIAAAPAGIGLFIGRDLLIENPNQTFIDIVGKGADIVGLPLREAMPELVGEGQPFLKILDDVFTTGIPFTSPASLVSIVQNGVLTNRYYNISYTALRNAVGEIYGVLDIAIDVTEQVKAQQAVTESEIRFRSLIEQSPMAIGLLKGREMILEIGNNRIFEVLGKDSSITGLPLIEALPEIKGQIFLDILEGVYDSGIPFFGTGVLAKLLRAGKLEEVYFDFTYTPVRDTTGEINGVMILATEVTEREIARTAIEESQRQLLSLFEESPVGIATISSDEDLVFETANTFYASLVGRKPEALLGRPLLEALPELKGQDFDVLLKKVISSGTSFLSNEVPVTLQYRGVLEKIYVNLAYQPRKDRTGYITGVLVVATDVTHQVTARKKLEESEAALRDAIKLADLGTWRIDAETRKVLYSERLQEWLGLESAVLTEEGSPLIHPNDRARVSAAIGEALRKGGSGRFNEVYTIINAITGRERVIRASGQTTYDKVGNPIVMAGTVQDITIQQELQLALEAQVQLRTEELQATVEELAESNTALQSSNEKLAQYAYVASHDLQEPLRKIRVFTGMLSSAKELLPASKTILAKINSSAERMSLLIQDLLAFSRLLQSDALLRPIHLQKTITDVWNDFELVVAEKKATIEIGKLPVIEGVNLQMNQLFYNLIGNALKFSEVIRRPHLSIESKIVTAEEVRKYANNTLEFTNYHHITVSDNGIGFDAQYNEQIFEVFKRLHGQDHFAGSGIGLSICRRIVANHQGYLYAVSQPGVGSTFHILLPDRQSNEISRYEGDPPLTFTHME